MQGKTIYDYTLKRLLGKGGMAEVWYAENEIGNAVAVKILNPDLSLNHDIANRFKREAAVTAELKHPNIRRVGSYVELEGRPCMIMEYLEGDDLKARMKRGERFSQQQLEKWWGQLVSALNYTHAQGVVHRDIKPANIFITNDGDVKLLDFGIAKVRDSLTSTSTGAQMGTLMYMSPEQIRDSKHIDYKSDIYSLAVTFVHLLSGVAPYDSNSSDDYTIRKNIVEAPLDLTGVPAAWKQFLLSYLAKEPKRRPALAEFGAYVPALPADGEGTVVVEPLPQPDPAAPDTPAPVPPAEKKSNAKKAVLITVICVLLAALAVAVVLLLTRGGATSAGGNTSATSAGSEQPTTSAVCKDADGNEYKTVQIGEQVWMAENMRATHGRDGSSISLGSSTSYDTPYRYNPDNNSANVSKYGYLYNWAAAEKVCPNGWHLPTEAEFQTLMDYCSDHYAAGGDRKNNAKALAATDGWEYPDYDWAGEYAVGKNKSANNQSGFSALPAGDYYGGDYDYFGDTAGFWSSTPYGVDGAYILGLSYSLSAAGLGSYYRNDGGSVRCLRD